MRSLPDLAEEALFIQDACNLSGLARSFVRVIDDIKALHPTNNLESCADPTWRRHPILKLWIDKMASMVGTQGEWDSATAYRAVNDIVDNNLLARLGA